MTLPCSRTRGICALLVATVALLILGTAQARAASTQPAWLLTAVAQPTNLAPGSTYASGGDSIEVTAMNIGGASTDGSTITVVDTLPAGITPDPAGNCAISGQQVTCTDDESNGPLIPGQLVQFSIPVDVSASAAADVTNTVSISGGGAPTVQRSTATTVSATPAAFGIADSEVESLNADGTPDSVAGSHPFQALASLTVNTAQTPLGDVVPAGNLRTVTAHLPAGLVGSPTVVPQCPLADLDSGSVGCPADTQVGLAEVTLDFSGETPEFVPVYNVTPLPGVPAELAFKVITSTVTIDFSVRSGSDYGLDATIHGINTAAPIYQTTILLWGDPADPRHDASRFLPAAGSPGDANGDPLPSGLPDDAFITNPTQCGVASSASLQADDWQAPGTEVLSAPSPFPALTGCDSEPFAPTVTVAPDTTSANSPTGLDLDLHVPQTTSAAATASAAVSDATISLPPGMRISPAGANGLQSCTPTQIALDDDSAPTCPTASTIGSVELDTPLLPDPLTGSLYLAQQSVNPFGSLLALYLDASADGVQVKLAGEVTPDPLTGQLTISFPDAPQLPFSDIKVDLSGGPEAVLVSPPSCGPTAVSTSLVSDSGQTVTPSSSPFSFTSGCVSGFAPTFTAGTANAQAGRDAPFALSFSRSDTDQELQGLTASLPLGLIAHLRGVGECSDAQLASISTAPGTGAAQAASPSCPAASQVGTVSITAGAGTSPYPLTGSAYLTGPYKGAPYGLAIVVPAVAGPIDLGTVVVRQALSINPRTARVSVTSDPFPTILDGIPLQIRSVSVVLNRPGFTVNPTSCAKTAVTATLYSTAGASAQESAPFQVGGCASLKFSPRLGLTLRGAHATRPGSHPRLTATLHQPGGQANLRSVRVTLPLSLALDPHNSRHLCSVAAAAKLDCPASTIVGSATAITRILPHPLSGDVYLVQGIRYDKHHHAIKTLPALLVPLHGRDGVAIDLTGQSSVNGASKLVATFGSIPDAAISTFRLSLTGGRRGILVVTGSKSICAGVQTGQMTATAHSGTVHTTTIAVRRTACGR